MMVVGETARLEAGDEIEILRLIVENSPLAMGIGDLNGNILYLNPVFLRQFGTQHSSTSTVADLIRQATLDPEDRQKVEDYWASIVLATAHEGTRIPPFTCRTEINGIPCDLLIRCVVSGNKVICTFGDVTELQNARRHLEIQRDLANELLHAPDQQAAFSKILQAAVRLPGFDCGGIYSRDPQTGHLRLVAHHGLSQAFLDMVSFHPTQSPQAQLVAAGSVICVHVRELPPAVAKAMVTEGLEALAIVPIRNGQEIIGTLNVSCHQCTAIDPSARIALENLAAQTESAVALIQARAESIIHARQTEHSLRQSRDQLQSKVAERTTELETANASLTEKASFLNLALRASQAGVWSWEVGDPGIEADFQTRDLLDTHRDGPVRLAEIAARIHPDDRRRLKQHVRSARAPGSESHWSHDFRIRHPDGTERWLAAVGQIVRDSRGNATRLAGICLDISARKQAEEQIRASELKYRRLHESMTDAFVRVDMAGCIVEWNQAYQDMLGYQAEEISNLTYFDITPPRWHELEALIVREHILTRGYSEPYEKEYIRKDGTVFPVELRTFLLRNEDGTPAEMWAIVRDITERKHAQQLMSDWNAHLEWEVSTRTSALTQSEARFRQLAEATSEGIAVTQNGIFIDGNQQLANLFGCPLDQMIGQPVLSFVAPESAELVTRSIREGVEAPYEFIGLRPDRTTFPASAQGKNRSWHGHVTRITAVQDLTPVRHAAELLQAQRDQLEQAMRLALVSEASSGILHQISQPLSAITCNVAAAKTFACRCQVQDCGNAPILMDIEADLTRARTIIEHLRHLALPERALRTATNLPNLIANVITLVREEASRITVKVSLVCPAPIPDVLADAIQIEQVILNLLRNAFDACSSLPPHHGDVSISVRTPNREAVEILVTDNGHGIPHDALPHIFEPFFTTKPKGTGIGLRLSQTILSHHGGTIQAFNNPSTPGATFRVTLPLVTS